jgi:predicted NACHT family NTPase
MTEIALTAATIAKILTPVVTEIFKGAKGALEHALKQSSITQTINSLADTLDSIDKVRTIWSAEDDISLDSFYYPSKLSHKGITKTVSSLDDLPKGNLIIEGTVGQGKSIFMRYLSLSIVRNDGGGLIPIFVELRSISKDRTLMQAIESVLDGCGFPLQSFAPLAKSANLVLLLDGYDEISSESETSVLETLDLIRKKYRPLKVIISSRPGNTIQNVAGFEIARLVRLTLKDYEPFMAKLGIDILKRTALIQAITESPANVSGVISTPLMLTLVIIVYETDQEIPTALSEFYEKLFYVVFTRHDRLKVAFNRKHHTGLSERKLQKLFETFCFMVIQSGHGRSLENNEFNECFDKAIKYSPDTPCELENFRSDIIKVACLMLEEGLGTSTFIHKSILDYFAAAFASKLSEGLKEKFYSRANSEYFMWEHVLHFLKDIDTYNYSKYYVLSSFPKTLEAIKHTLESQSTEEFILRLQLIISNTDIGLEKETLRPQIWTNSRHTDNEPTTKLEALVMSNVVAKIAKAPEEDVRTAMRESFYTGRIFTDSEHMNLRGYIRAFGTEKIIESLKLVSLEVSQSLRNAEETISTEEQKNHLFD